MFFAFAISFWNKRHPRKYLMKNAQCMKAANDRLAKVVVLTLKFMSLVIFIWLLISLSED